MKNEYYGKYRAKVVDIQDPEKRGRIRVMCPKVVGNFKSAWCEPCVPVAYDFGGDFAIPKVNEFVWIEFEEGNPNKPIYLGGLWCTEKSPSETYETGDRLITWGKCKIKITKDDVITISVGSSSITVKSDSIKISTPRLDLN